MKRAARRGMKPGSVSHKVSRRRSLDDTREKRAAKIERIQLDAGCGLTLATDLNWRTAYGCRVALVT